MSNSEQRDSIDTRNTDHDDEVESRGGDVDGGSDVDLVRERGNDLTERLTEVIVGGGEGDLLVGESVLQWIQALDMQVMGACRVDERLKPLLKSGGGGNGADDRLLAHLSQYFEPSEVGLLAMCLCMPLVSMRVGKVLKQGNLLLPTTDRGDLNLVLLPSSDLRLSFVGDDGQAETLFTLCCNSDCSTALIEEIPADSSGRSFLVKCPNSSIYYFWCSEKSRILGNEILDKMKDLCERKPSLAELTGISESRLDYFATHLRAHFSGSTSNTRRPTSKEPSSQRLISSELAGRNPGLDLDSLVSGSVRHRTSGNQTVKSSSPCQISLSPRPNLFKEGGMGRTPFKNVAREKWRRRAGDNILSVLDNIDIDSAVGSRKFSDESRLGNHSELSEVLSAAQSSIQSLELVPPSFCSLTADLSPKSAFCSPAYCLCPIGSTFQTTTGPLTLPLATTNLRKLPPLASLLAGTSSIETPSTTTLQLCSHPLTELPSFIPDTMGRLSLSMPSTYQISTFASIICDPIVHIPVIDICSSGQAYLVSAASGTTLHPLHSTLVSQMLPQDNMVENGAMETLRQLMASSDQASPSWIDMLTKDDEKPGILVGGSHGLYSGTCDVEMIANSIAALGMISLTERSIQGDNYSTKTIQGNCEMEASNMDHPLNQVNPDGMDERQE